ncbi:MAG: hypothetical protein ACRDZ6_05485 [Acidimicrobiales bacterium]
MASTCAAVLTALGLVVATPSADASPGAGTGNSAAISSEAQWIMSAQLPDGAIAVWPDKPVLRLIWPYVANGAAAGLARATEVTGDPSYARAAWAYLDWYSSVEDPTTGYVTDYNVVGGTTPVSDGNYDSTDAYAGTFLAAAWDTYSATGDMGAVDKISSGISGAISAIASTQQSNGLTFATPSYQVAYLMDNVQALGGLESAAALESALGNPTLAAEATSRADEMREGIASLWDPATGAYDWAWQPNGYEHPTDWSNFYPDAMEQAAAVEWGAVPAGRAATLMSSFDSHHSDWSDPNATDYELQGGTVVDQPIGYWPDAGVAFDAAGETGTGESGTTDILAAAAAAAYGWPFTTGDAGAAIVALSGEAMLDSFGGTTSSPPTGPPSQPPPPAGPPSSPSPSNPSSPPPGTPGGGRHPGPPRAPVKHRASGHSTSSTRTARTRAVPGISRLVSVDGAGRQFLPAASSSLLSRTGGSTASKAGGASGAAGGGRAGPAPGGTLRPGGLRGPSGEGLFSWPVLPALGFLAALFWFSSTRLRRRRAVRAAGTASVSLSVGTSAPRSLGG